MEKKGDVSRTRGPGDAFPSVSPPAALATARLLLATYVKELGIQISDGLGSDAAVELEELFINLQLLPKQEAAKLFENVSFSSHGDQERLHLLGRREQHTQQKQSHECADGDLVELEKLLDAGDDAARPHNVLALGGAGSGKTTVFLQMLVYLCCTKGLWSERFGLVFGIEMRDESVQKAESLQDLLAARFAELDMKDGEVAELSDYFRLNPNRLCMVLDGLDESDVGACSTYMQKVLERKALAGVQVIVTSRVCEAARKLSQCGKYQRQLEVIGFSASNVREFVRKVVVERADEMLHQISENAELAGMMCTPLFASLACSMFVDGKEISVCITHLYKSMVLRLFGRSCQKVYNSFEEVDAIEMQTLLELGRFSFRMLAERKLVFEGQELDAARLSENARRLGLLMTFKASSPHHRRQYRFVHLSLQEFLSAWFMKQCVVKEADDAMKLVESLRECSGHLTMFWRFLVALCEHDVADPLLEKLWRGMRGQFVRSPDPESETPSAVCLANEMIHSPSVLCNDGDFEAVERGLGIRLCYEDMRRLANALLEKSHGRGNGHKCVLSEIPRGRDLTNQLYLQTLVLLWRQHADVTRCSHIHEALLKISPQLADECMDFLNPAAQLGPGNLEVDERPLPRLNSFSRLLLLQAFYEHSRYHNLAASVLSPVVEKLLQGARLTLYGVQLSVVCCKAVEHALCRHAATVQGVYIFDCNIYDMGLSILAPALCRCTGLSKLQLSFNRISDGVLLSNVVSHLSENLTVLGINGNPIGDEGFDHLSQSLVKCASLRELNIDRMSLTGASLPAIAMVMERCSKIQEVYMLGNALVPASQDAEVHFVKVLSNHPRLLYVNLDVGDISHFLRDELVRAVAAKKKSAQ